MRLKLLMRLISTIFRLLLKLMKSPKLLFLSEKSFLDDSVEDLDPIPVIIQILSFIGLNYEKQINLFLIYDFILSYTFF